MRRLAISVVAVAIIAAATALAVAVASSRDTSATSSLTVTYWADGAKGTSVKRTLRCGPAGGTLERPVRACTRLRAGGMRLFAPVPSQALCTQIYGGPQVARVAGKFGARRVDATFSRKDGCQIERWNKVSPWLLPPGGV